MELPAETPVPSGDAPGSVQQDTAKAVPAAAEAEALPLWAGDDALSEFPTEAELHAARLVDGARAGVRRKRWTVGLAAGVVLLALIAGGAWRWRADARPAVASPEPTGVLSIESSPPGARVVIDGRDRGATPLTLPLATGRHAVLLTTNDASRAIDVSVQAGAQLVHHVELVKAEPAAGRVQVVSSPASATVALDGTPRGVTPIELTDVPAGAHTITVGDGVDAVSQSVIVPAGGVASLVVPLGQAAKDGPGWISILAPVELQIFEGDALVGTSRSERIMVLAGRHTLRLSNPGLGFETTRTVAVERGRVATVRLDLPNGVLNVNAVPWAEVLLDGRKIGETPIANFAVAIGPHEIVLRNPKFPELRQSVVVTLSSPARVGVDLRQ